MIDKTILHYKILEKIGGGSFGPSEYLHGPFGERTQHYQLICNDPVAERTLHC
jgi:hypothetical protein